MTLFLAHSHADEPGDDRRDEKKAQAVSKADYDRLLRTQEAIDYLSSLGISAEDIEPNNLQFASESLYECLEQAEESLTAQDELAIARVGCLKRHVPSSVTDDPD